jgi:hypothetical protein
MLGLLVFKTYLWKKLLDLNFNKTGLELVSLVATINYEPWYILSNPFDFSMTKFVKSVFPPCALSV